MSAALTTEQKLEALYDLWERQEDIWSTSRANYIERINTALNENNLIGNELRMVVAERDALLAQPSKLFEPKLTDVDARQAERAAFAAGLHHASTMLRRAPAETQQKEAA